MWANTLNIPIFSIDYRLSPQEQFPAALNDVWQTYYWLVFNAESKFGIKPDKIILVGDSAGGNLITATTLLAIERGFRKPDGLILCYPAMSLSKLRFVPSLLLATDDQLLPYPFLKMCLDSYIGDFS
jgi:hormone-sensitive lipase